MHIKFLKTIACTKHQYWISKYMLWNSKNSHRIRRIILWWSLLNCNNEFAVPRILISKCFRSMWSLYRFIAKLKSLLTNFKYIILIKLKSLERINKFVNSSRNNGLQNFIDSPIAFKEIYQMRRRNDSKLRNRKSPSQRKSLSSRRERQIAVLTGAFYDSSAGFASLLPLAKSALSVENFASQVCISFYIYVPSNLIYQHRVWKKFTSQLFSRVRLKCFLYLPEGAKIL